MVELAPLPVLSSVDLLVGLTGLFVDLFADLFADLFVDLFVDLFSSDDVSSLVSESEPDSSSSSSSVEKLANNTWSPHGESTSASAGAEMLIGIVVLAWKSRTSLRPFSSSAIISAVAEEISSPTASAAETIEEATSVAAASIALVAATKSEDTTLATEVARLETAE